jgi:hypothetical protein
MRRNEKDRTEEKGCGRLNQVLWALLLVYCILFGVAILFGPGRDIPSPSVSVSLLRLLPVTFTLIHLLAACPQTVQNSSDLPSTFRRKATA